jgi:hypothetical protein
VSISVEGIQIHGAARGESRFRRNRERTLQISEPGIIKPSVNEENTWKNFRVPEKNMLPEGKHLVQILQNNYLYEWTKMSA